MVIVEAPLTPPLVACTAAVPVEGGAENRPAASTDPLPESIAHANEGWAASVRAQDVQSGRRPGDGAGRRGGGAGDGRNGVDDRDGCRASDDAGGRLHGGSPGGGGSGVEPGARDRTAARRNTPGEARLGG